jgi:CubicO group peptidase (beta-lactamase class C family)
MAKINRRTAMAQIFGAAASLALVPRVHGRALPGFGTPPQEREMPTGPEHEAMAALGIAFMKTYFAPALSVAMVRNSKFVFERVFGMADSDKHELTSQTSLFRIASLTKPITSVAIFTLVEQGKVNLSDKVFGPSGILDGMYGKGPYKQYVTDITVDHLLTHTCGGWPADDNDPMFHNDGWDQAKLISSTIENVPLTSPPGQNWAYSNFGYCILGRVIEKITGQPYASYVQQAVLGPSQITDMQIAGNTERERAADEVSYLGQFGEQPYKMNVRRMDSHGGWIANPNDLCRFISHVGGSPTIPALLKPATIKMMTTPTPAYPASSPAKYARGWMVRDMGNGSINWWHNGSLPGSTTIMVRTYNGMAWAALTNTRTQPSNQIDTALDQMMWNMAGQVKSWNM